MLHLSSAVVLDAYVEYVLCRNIFIQQPHL